MHIRSISLSNVKSFRDPIHVKLDPHFNLLIGPNGGGKSNLFDAITIVLRRYFLDSFKVSFHGLDKALKSAIREQETPVLDRFIGKEKLPATIEIEMVITARDIANIRVIKSHLKTFNTLLENYKWRPINNCNFIEKWDIATLEKERVVRYKIVNDSFSPAPEPGTSAFIFKEYLSYLEMFLLFAKDMGVVDLRPVLLNFFPIRSMTRDNIQVSLSLQNYYQLLHDFHLATSQDATSLMQLSTYYFAVKKLKLQEQSKHEGYLKLWNSDPEVDSVTKAIAHLGFTSWMPYPVELERGLYQILLEKDGKEYLISQASSGEKEILN
ncbi:MAG: AAA family ATPase, partial [Alphaproteobacteria bacterium]|nr:AAA family ATPase [Alphaproteobacteria bacterium]